MDNRNLLYPVLLVSLSFGAIGLGAAETIDLSSLDLTPITQDYGSPQANRSVDGHLLSINKEIFNNGVGTHAVSTWRINLNGSAKTFSATVGVDDEMYNPDHDSRSSVEFLVYGDDKILWRSGIMRAGQAAQQVEVTLKGRKILKLVVSDGGDGNDSDHADWAEAQIQYRGKKPESISAQVDASAFILTPPSPATPRIHGAKVFGVRPKSPFLFTVAATGDRPMTFSATGLPEGLTLGASTGRITGQLSTVGEYKVSLEARNSLGSSRRDLVIKVGDAIGLTPPMGWNSWNCFASAVTDQKIRAAADAFVTTGLINHGWTYVNIDDFWQVNLKDQDPTLHGPERDESGNILPNSRFPDMKGLAQYIHNLGLKAGLYSTPGPYTCGGCTGSYQHEEQDAQTYATWGFDYLKYDWCSYNEIYRKEDGGQGLEGQKKPYLVMAQSLKKVPRDLFFSFCQYGMYDVWKWGAGAGGQSWRTTGDIHDSWHSMIGNSSRQIGLEQYVGPGHWNDPDMLVVGKVGWGPSLHSTHLTPNEQYTHISLWCLQAAPLLIGCDLTQLDPFTLNLLTNDEVLDVDQDSLGRQGYLVSHMTNQTPSLTEETEVWAKPLEDGSIAVGLFNLGEESISIPIKWLDLKLSGSHHVRDLWRQKDLGSFPGQFAAAVPSHGVILVRVLPSGAL